MIKDSYGFEFLEIPEDKPAIEKDLEKTLVWHIENFLMEHGNESKGYENT